MLGAGCWVQGAGFRVQGSGFRVQGSGFRGVGLGMRDEGTGRSSQTPRPVASSACEVSGFRVEGLGGA